MSSNENCDASMNELDDKSEEPSSISETNTPKDGENLRENTESVEVAPNVNSNVNTSNNEIYKPMAIKKKHRRGSRRSKKKYKPYSKLTWEEKKAVEERDSRRAVSIREKYMHEKGRPLAPFNTSQFLMAEHDTQEPDLHVHNSHSRTTRFSSSADDSDEMDSSLSDEERDDEDVRNFLQKDFTETYDRFHSETLRRMNKEQLINEYMELEDKVENLERELTAIKANGNSNGYNPPGDEINNAVDTAEDVNSRQTLEYEIEKLRAENHRLRAENVLIRPLEMMKNVPTI